MQSALIGDVANLLRRPRLVNRLRKGVWMPACAIILMLAFSAADAAHINYRYTKDIARGCLVRIDVDYGKIADTARVQNDIFFSFFKSATKRRPEIPDYEIAHGPEGRRYLLYSARCEKRFEFTREMVRTYKADHPGEADITIGEQTVPPSDQINKLFFLPGKPKYNRRECRVTIELIYQEKRKKFVEEAKFFDYSTIYINENYPEISPFAISWYDRKHWYLQYWQSCDRKLEMTRELINAYKKKFPGGPDFVITDDTIYPEDLSSGSFGLHWIDGQISNFRRSR